MANRIRDATFCSTVRREPKECELLNIYESSQTRVRRIIHRKRIRSMQTLLLPMRGIIPTIPLIGTLLQRAKDRLEMLRSGHFVFVGVATERS